MRLLPAILLALVAASCAAPHREAGPASSGSGDAAATSSTPGIPAESLGLAPGDLSGSPAPPASREIDAAPGELPPPERAYEGAPPVIPHAIGDFLPITREENGCILCHQVEEKIEGEATPIPRSHYTDLRRAPDEVGEEIAGARASCTTCHVAQTNAKPLVENRFKSRQP